MRSGLKEPASKGAARTDEPFDPPISRVLVALVILFVVYQASEGLQTVFAPGSVTGPALMLAAVLLPWPLGHWIGFRGYEAFGLDLRRRSAGLVASLVIVASFAFLASRAIGSDLGIYSPTAGPAIGLPAVAIVSAAFMTFVPSLAEDIITRGFLLKAVPLRLGLVGYAVATALLYTGNHVWRFDWGISEQIRLFCLGLAYGAAAYRWRTLWGAVALHWGWNLSNLLADKFIPADTLEVVQGRYLSAAVHLLLFAIVLLIPAPQVEASRQGGAAPRPNVAA